MKKAWVLLLLLALLLTGCAPARPGPGPVPEPMDVSAALTLTLHRDGRDYGPYTMLTPDFNLTQARDASLSPAEAPGEAAEWITVTQGQRSWTVYPGSPMTVKSADEYYISQASYSSILLAFYALENICLGPISFACAGQGEQALREYVQTALPARFAQYAPGSPFTCRDYAPISVSEGPMRSGLAQGTIRFAATAGADFYPYSLSGQVSEGTGAYAGKVIVQTQVVLERHSDGCWYVIPSGEDTYAAVERYPASDEAYLDPTVAEEASAYLDTLAEYVAARESEDDLQALVDLADRFCRSLLAIPLSGRLDFDLGLFCAPEALKLTGMGYLKNNALDRRADTLTGALTDPVIFTAVTVQGDRAMVYHSRIQIYFQRDDTGAWRICDVTVPYAGQ